MGIQLFKNLYIFFDSELESQFVMCESIANVVKGYVEKMFPTKPSKEIKNLYEQLKTCDF